ncbi:peptidylprolyl isomerase [Rhodohalobacter sulfatireducens]|uniref:Peptidylprolyl isomerase n=1 Tax=Rhodohalobacter sulfatireducens TaxID=2911366 RepID=A0ABS9KCW1_9BACT|nr:peptidylprolyl isomerase [Rhodohalobacter sulfatireducens]MCG2588676.1 peptidylprolyl isomerase [Rhodohalobacter sulfatireducens]
MNTFFKGLNTFLLLLIFSAPLLSQDAQVSDRIVAIVNDRIILKSDVDEEVQNYLRQARVEGQTVNFSEDIWYSALQSMVDNYVLLQKAQIDSVVVSDEQVNRMMDQRIQQLTRQAGSEQALENAFGQSLVEIRAEFREQFRDQLTAQRVQQTKIQEISITRPEVVNFFNQIPEDQIPIIPEQVAISQIVAIPPPLDDAREAAFQEALALRDSVTTGGKNFEEMAEKYSDGPTGPRGGLLPLMPLDDLVANYSAAASALEPGEISEVVETQFGFHVIRLNRRVGDEIETNHILIEIGDESLNEEAAINKLEALRDSVLNHGESFDDLARRHSEDEQTAPLGGKIYDQQTGARLIPLDQLDPALYRIVLLLDEEGQISEPKSYNPNNPNVNRAFRIVSLDRNVPEHRANLETDYDRIRQSALSQKQNRIMRQWIDELRNEVYVEFKIPVPDNVSTQAQI